MTIFRYNPQKPGPADSSSTAWLILYWSLRGFTFLIALCLGFMIIAAYVGIPFYASEGYSAQFEDRILLLLSEFLLFVSIIVPHRWSLTGAGFLIRVATISLVISSTVVVDLIAYKRGLTTSPFTAASSLALIACAALLATLQLEKHRRRAFEADSERP